MSRFWEEKPIAALSDDEWERLCDGCGKCCLHKLQCDETEAVFYTDVACQLLDLQTCRCVDYPHRLERVSSCVKLDKNNLSEWNFLPSTCAYRLVLNGEALPDWHPLIDKSGALLFANGHSVAGRVFPESAICEEDLEEHVIHWV